MANSVDPDQTAPSGAVWSVSTLFAYVILSDVLVFEFLEYLPYLHKNSLEAPQQDISNEYPHVFVRNTKKHLYFFGWKNVSSGTLILIQMLSE